MSVLSVAVDILHTEAHFYCIYTSPFPLSHISSSFFFFSPSPSLLSPFLLSLFPSLSLFFSSSPFLLYPSPPFLPPFLLPFLPLFLLSPFFRLPSFLPSLLSSLYSPNSLSPSLPPSLPLTDKGNIQLWEFLLELLLAPDHGSIIQWTGSSYEFCIVNPGALANLWGTHRNKPRMTYEKLSRALRYYYSKGIMEKVPGKRLTYKFLFDIQKYVIRNQARTISIS